MCNEAARRISLHQLREDWSELKIPLRFPEGLPNMAPLESIRITDQAVIIRAASDAPGEAEMVTRRLRHRESRSIIFALSAASSQAAGA